MIEYVHDFDYDFGPIFFALFNGTVALGNLQASAWKFLWPALICGNLEPELRVSRTSPHHLASNRRVPGSGKLSLAIDLINARYATNLFSPEGILID